MTADAPGDPSLARRAEKLGAILEVAKALTVQRDLDRLLTLILEAATRVVDADWSSIFLVDRERQELWTRVAQGTSEIRIPWGTGIAGHVARTGETVHIRDAYADPRFNRSIDLSTGYVTRTMLCVPMRTASGASVAGVLEALNKSDGDFTAEDEELLLALGGQAAAAVENVMLHEEIGRLFEGFVGASVVAIESRDPTTAGHSGRVATLTVCLAQALERAQSGPHAGTRFSREELDEIRYAALLHDFGKVGVRERVLVKAEKLYPHEVEALQARFELARARLLAEGYRRELDVIYERGAEEAADALAIERTRLAKAYRELDEALEFALACNRPAVLPALGFERLAELATRTFPDGKGGRLPLLTPHEVEALSIAQGSLSQDERREIESHVTWTHRFLSQIPWTRALRRVPQIAFAHHEKLSGQGYPRRLAAEQIPVQSRMMTVSDIYDALTAHDRPYKKAMPPERALDILQREATSGQIDADLFRIFVEARIFERTSQP